MDYVCANCGRSGRALVINWPRCLCGKVFPKKLAQRIWEEYEEIEEDLELEDRSRPRFA